MAKKAMVVKHTKKGMNKLAKNLFLLQQDCVSVGIHKSDNAPTSDGRDGSFNLASLAYYLEQTVSWIQNKTVVVPADDGSNVVIYKGSRMVRPARIFITIFKLDNVWNKIRSFIQEQVKALYLSAGSSKKSFWKNIGNMAKNEQKAVIQTSSSATNSDLTTKIKGFNHPLFHTGGLLNAINYQVRKNPSANNKIDKNNFLMHLDVEMGKLQ